MKKIKNIVITIFMVLILLPLAFFNWEKDFISKIDNRKLTNFPSLETINTDTVETFNKYLSDRLGFREEMITWYSDIHLKMFHTLVHPDYIYGEDDYIFFDIYQKSYNEHTDKFVQTIQKVAKYVESRGAKFYILINPEKTSVYTDKLPKGTNYNRLWLDQVENRLSEANIQWIDNIDILKEKKKTELVYNKQYDVGHWNDNGAFYGTNNLLEWISKDFPKVRPHYKDDFTIGEEFEQYLPTSKIEVNEMVPVYELKNKDYIDLTEEFDSLVKRDYQQNHFSYIKNESESSNLPNVLVFQGSYLNGREKFLADRFKEYMAVHNYENIFDVDYYFNIFQPDIVVFEVAEYTIHEQYFATAKMDSVHLNPPINNHLEMIETDKKEVSISEDLINTIEFQDENKEIEFAYLKMNDRYYDFSKKENIFELSLKKENFELNDAYIIYKKVNDSNYYIFKVSK